MRTVCAYSLWFPHGATAAEVWRVLTSSIAAWYANEPDARLPESWANGTANVVTPLRGHSLECAVSHLADSSGPLRELFWVYPDSRDETLLWTIEAAVLEGDGAVFTLLLRIASADFELLPARFQLHTPRVVRQLVARGDAHIGVHPIDASPTLVTPDGVPELVALLLEQSRRHPVVVLSPEELTDDRYVVDPDLLANALAGLASVFVLDSRWATFALTDEVGKRLSCYNGAVRIYWPRFSYEADPFAHPLWLPPQIDDFGGPDGFARMLMRMIASVASFRFVEPDPIRFFRSKVENERLTRLRAESKQTGFDQLFDEYVKLDAQARELRERLDGALEENAELKAQLASRLITRTEERTIARSAPGADDRPEPTNVLAALEEARGRTSNLVFLPEAFESARESPFKQTDKVYSALLAIDDVAGLWSNQLSSGGKLGARRDLFRARGFEYKEDISQTAEGKWGAEYTYQYSGRRIVFAPHITIGSKSPDRCLSIHLHWDDVTRKAVIAHVGRHKTNTRT